MGSLYDKIGVGYSATRQPDPRIADRIIEALGDSDSVVNVGVGAGSYEPRDRLVIAVEPSATMIRQRPVGSAPAIQGVAESLPLVDGAGDSALAILTVHHWADPAQVLSVSIPHDCIDGFQGAFWRRPEAYLDPRVRSGISTLAVMSPDERDEGLGRLAADIQSGAWEDRHRSLLDLDELDLGYRLIVATRGAKREPTSSRCPTL